MKKIVKIIRDSGICSKRDADKLIEQGRVALNGNIVYTPWIQALEKEDEICVDGKKLPHKPSSALMAFYKPRLYLTTKQDPQNRPTIYDLLEPQYRKFMYVGRLDYNSEGLLLLTNHAQIKEHLEKPSNNFLRIYQVRGFGNVNKNQILNTKAQVIDGILYKIEYIKIIKENKMNNWFEIGIREGKNREVRKIFDHFNIKINKLIRTHFGPYNLGSLKQGKVKQVTNILNF